MENEYLYAAMNVILILVVKQRETIADSAAGEPVDSAAGAGTWSARCSASGSPAPGAPG